MYTALLKQSKGSGAKQMKPDLATLKKDFAPTLAETLKSSGGNTAGAAHINPLNALNWRVSRTILVLAMVSAA